MVIRRYLPILAYLAAFVLVVALPHAASAQTAPTGASFNVISYVAAGFKNALVTTMASLIVIGLFAAGAGWMMRTQEGLGPVFFGGVTIAIIGVIVLLGDLFVTILQNYIAGQTGAV